MVLRKNDSDTVCTSNRTVRKKVIIIVAIVRKKSPARNKSATITFTIKCMSD